MTTIPIWFATPDLKALNGLNKNTLGESIGLEFTEVGSDFIVGTIPVDERTKQPFGLLHGGASVSLAETLGSVASMMVVDMEKFIAVGIEINANHIKAVMGGKVTGVCKALSVSGRTHIWDIKIYNEDKELSCISRFTCAIVPRSKFQ